MRTEVALFVQLAPISLFMDRPPRLSTLHSFTAMAELKKSAQMKADGRDRQLPGLSKEAAEGKL
jgi:hypothetical protein